MILKIRLLLKYAKIELGKYKIRYNTQNGYRYPYKQTAGQTIVIAYITYMQSFIQ